MENSEAFEATEAQRGIELANRVQLILGADFIKYKDRYLEVAESVNEQSLAELEEVLNNTPDNRDAVVKGWLRALESAQELKSNFRKKFGSSHQ